MSAAIALVNLSKRYGSFPALRSVNLTVNAGEVFGLLGPNGAGKTTAFKLLMGILKPSDGRVLVNGVDCNQDAVAAKRAIGYLPEEPIPYDFLTGREILEFVGEMHRLPPPAAQQRAGQLLGELELGAAADEFASDYSAGMKKRLALACAVIHQPPILLLDEPTNSLDPAGARQLRGWIAALAGAGQTVLLSTHLVDMAERMCTRVGILARGELLAVGTPPELVGALAPGGTLEDAYISLTENPGTRR